MITIHKQILLAQQFQNIEVPSRSKILSVNMQAGKIAIWYICEIPSIPMIKKIMILGTGHTMPSEVTPESAQYIGTIMTADDELVFHVFEVVEQLTT
jgi:hypothetical protein